MATWGFKSNTVYTGYTIENDSGVFPNRNSSVSISNDGSQIVITTGKAIDPTSAIIPEYGEVFTYKYIDNTNIQGYQPLHYTIKNNIPETRLGERCKLSSNGKTALFSINNIVDRLENDALIAYEYNDLANNKFRSHWKPKGQLIKGSDNNANDNFGKSFDITDNGNRIVVSESCLFTQTNTSNDHVYIFHYNDSSNLWNQSKTFGDPAPSINDNYGASVAINGSGNTIIVGADGGKNSISNDNGKAYVYSYNGSNWSQKGNTITGNDVWRGARSGFGTSVDISNNGNIVSISSQEGTLIGSQARIGFIYNYLYNSETNEWDLLGSVIKNPRLINFPLVDQFNDVTLYGGEISLSADGSRLVTSDVYANSNNKTWNGKVYTYDFIVDDWEKNTIDLVGENSYDLYGSSFELSRDGNNLIVSSTDQRIIVLTNDFTELYSNIYTYNGSTPPCFLAGSLIETDQGLIEVENINTNIHTIRDMKILSASGNISKNTDDNYFLVSFDKDSLGKDMPFKKTIFSPDHMVWFNNKFITAKKMLINHKIEGINSVPYNNERLYNILLKDYSHIFVNGLKVETLHPKNNWAKLNF